MIVPFSGRPTADMVRVPVGGRLVTVFAAIFGSQANRALSSCPRSIRHTDLRWPPGVEWIGDKHHTIHYRPFSVTGNRPVGLTFCLPRQPFGFAGGKVGGRLDPVASSDERASPWGQNRCDRQRPPVRRRLRVRCTPKPTDHKQEARLRVVLVSVSASWSAINSTSARPMNL
jgi:hypothetical protein